MNRKNKKMKNYSWAWIIWFREETHRN